MTAPDSWKFTWQLVWKFADADAPLAAPNIERVT